MPCATQLQKCKCTVTVRRRREDGSSTGSMGVVICQERPSAHDEQCIQFTASQDSRGCSENTSDSHAKGMDPKRWMLLLLNICHVGELVVIGPDFIRARLLSSIHVDEKSCIEQKGGEKPSSSYLHGLDTATKAAVKERGRVVSDPHSRLFLRILEWGQPNLDAHDSQLAQGHISSQ